MSNDENLNQWERILTPQILRANLAVASLYIVAFESLKACIVDRIRDFFLTGWDGEKDIIDPTYIDEVLSTNRSGR